MKREELMWVLIRIIIGYIFLWRFLDLLFGLSYSAAWNQGWLAGFSPTQNFLSVTARGPLEMVFQAMAGNPIVDTIFMAGLLLIGIALLFGITKKIAGYSGALMMFLIWLSLLPTRTTPFANYQLVFIFILILLAHKETKFSLSNWWKKLKIVKKHPILE